MHGHVRCKCDEAAVGGNHCLAEKFGSKEKTRVAVNDFLEIGARC